MIIESVCVIVWMGACFYLNLTAARFSAPPPPLAHTNKPHSKRCQIKLIFETGPVSHSSFFNTFFYTQLLLTPKTWFPCEKKKDLNMNPLRVKKIIWQDAEASLHMLVSGGGGVFTRGFWWWWCTPGDVIWTLASEYMSNPEKCEITLSARRRLKLVKLIFFQLTPKSLRSSFWSVQDSTHSSSLLMASLKTLPLWPGLILGSKLALLFLVSIRFTFFLSTVSVITIDS